MRYAELCWKDAKGNRMSPLVLRVYFCRERTAPKTRARLRQCFPNHNFTNKLEDAAGFFSYLGRKAGTPCCVVACAGATRDRRIQVIAHEACHLAHWFLGRRTLPKVPGHNPDREELQCRWLIAS